MTQPQEKKCTCIFSEDTAREIGHFKECPRVDEKTWWQDKEEPQKKNGKVFISCGNCHEDHEGRTICGTGKFGAPLKQNKPMTQEKKEKEYEVKMDVFFMESHCVMAKNKKEAFEKAKELVRHGMGEEVTLFEIEKIT